MLDYIIHIELDTNNVENIFSKTSRNVCKRTTEQRYKHNIVDNNRTPFHTRISLELIATYMCMWASTTTPHSHRRRTGSQCFKRVLQEIRTSHFLHQEHTNLNKINGHAKIRVKLRFNLSIDQYDSNG